MIEMRDATRLTDSFDFFGIAFFVGSKKFARTSALITTEERLDSVFFSKKRKIYWHISNSELVNAKVSVRVDLLRAVVVAFLCLLEVVHEKIYYNRA